MSHQLSYVDEEWLPQPKRRSRLRRLLLVTLAAALVFWAGVEVQQRWGAGRSTGTAAGQLPSGGTGGFPGEMPSGFPGQASGSGDQGDSTQQGTDGGSTTSDQVIGTVVAKHGSVWVVQDLGGTTHRIKVTDGTSVIQEKKVAGSAVKTGSTVDITVSADDSGTADTVTVR